MLMRVFLGWLRGERGHCGMVVIPTMEEEDARRAEPLAHFAHTLDRGKGIALLSKLSATRFAGAGSCSARSATTALIVCLFGRRLKVTRSGNTGIMVYPDSIAERKRGCQGKGKRFMWGHDSRWLS